MGRTRSAVVFDPRDPGARRFARIVAEELVLLLGRGTLTSADTSPRRPEKGDGPWRSGDGASERSAPTNTEESGESSWLQREAIGLLRTMRAKPKRKR